MTCVLDNILIGPAFSVCEGKHQSGCPNVCVRPPFIQVRKGIIGGE